MKDSRGFTLLEVIVATLILAVAIVGLLAGITGALRNAARLTDYDRAVQLARLRMNDLLVDPVLPLGSVASGDFDPQVSGGLQAGWRALRTNFETPPNPLPGEPVVDRIQLEVWWMSGSKQRSFRLEGYRQRWLTAKDIQPGGAQGGP